MSTAMVPPEPLRAKPRADFLLLILLGIGLEGVFICIGWGLSTSVHDIPPFVWLCLLAFGLYGLALGLVLRLPQDRAILRVVLAFALLFRLTLVFVQGHPYLPDQDAYRYLWDGRVTCAGMNPYRFSPKEISEFMEGDGQVNIADEERRTLARLAGLAREPAMRAVFESIGHREVRTIYPPASQLLFALAAGIRPGSFIAYKLLLLLLEAATIPALLGLLRRTGRNPTAVIVYAWSPLVTLEFSYAGHQDALAVTMMVLGFAGAATGRPWWSGAFLGLGILGKLYPATLIGILSRWTGRRALLAATGTLVLLTLPFAGAGFRLLSGASVYATTWKWNAGFFAILERVLLLATPHASLIARILVGGILLGAMALLARRPVGGAEDAIRKALVILSTLLLLSPVLDPWYVTWIVPLLCVFPSPSLILLSGCVFIHYARYAYPGFHDPGWIVPLEFGVFYVSAGIEITRRWLRG